MIRELGKYSGEAAVVNHISPSLEMLLIFNFGPPVLSPSKTKVWVSV
jgi:hypothetical protein